MTITAEELRSILAYNPETGAFTWKVTASNRRQAGELAGCKCKRSGYMLIGYKGVVYPAHRLAWLHVYGTWPTMDIDHINGIPGDDRICNLRLATHQQNMSNRGRQKNNSSGYKGVYRHQEKWRARITVAGKSVSLGVYHNPEEAHRAYAEAASRYNGDFARAK